MKFVYVRRFEQDELLKRSRNIFRSICTTGTQRQHRPVYSNSTIPCSFVVYKTESRPEQIMSSISILHRACLRVALLPLPPLRARASATALRPPSPLRRHLQLPRRSAMSSAASRLSHIAAATAGGSAAGESNEPPPAGSAAAQEDNGTCPLASFTRNDRCVGRCVMYLWTVGFGGFAQGSRGARLELWLTSAS